MTDTHDTKVCSKCGEKRHISQFAKQTKAKDGLQNKCKICNKEYRNANKERIKKYLTDYQLKNRDVLIAKKRQYRINNLDKIRKKGLIWAKNNQEKVRANQKKQWYKNKEKYYAANYKRNSNRRKTDHLYAMRLRISHRLRLALRGIGMKKSITTKSIIGCSWEQLKIHIETQFIDGMTWENRSAWHIDHKIPLSTAKTEEDVIRLSHYTNLQPLWAKDNLRKSNKLDYQL